MWRSCRVVLPALVLAFWSGPQAQSASKELLEDPSFEIPMQRNQFGHVFAKWGGWKYEGECEFRVGSVAHSGKHSCLLFGGAGGKIRVAAPMDLAPGKYKITAYVRGLDIGEGVYNISTEFMFNNKYINIYKIGTFGWTKMTYVGELAKAAKTGPSFGLFGPGYFWIDDVSLTLADPSEPLTPTPVLGQEEAPIAAAVPLGADAVRCAECGYRNPPGGGACYACGAALEAKPRGAVGPDQKVIASFEKTNPFEGGTIVEAHATEGRRALRIDKPFVRMSQPQSWLGYDFLEADMHTDAKVPLSLYVEVRDASTRDYWTRVNYQTVVPPGSSTFILPIKQLYVGEKSRPGRMLELANIRSLVFEIGAQSPAPLFVDNLRLVRDDSPAKVQFEGLYAFDFGTTTSPVLEGFKQITPGTLYSPGRGYGLQNAKIWRAFDVLQPDPLYQDFICIESGGLAVDVPNGRYRVVVNIDNPSGFWGEYQLYRKRSVLAEGRPVVREVVDFPAFRKKYFRFWNVEDRSTDDTFDKYQKAYFHEKVINVDVADRQLNIDFQGENWGCSVSSIIIYPLSKAAEGAKFLQYVEAKRRFYFNNSFKRVAHVATGDPLAPTDDDRARGFITFQRDPMLDVYDNDRPFQTELGGPLRGEAFAGELEPLTLGIVPLDDLGKVAVTPSDLVGPAGTIPARQIKVGWVSNRVTRVTAEGSVYTITPRLIMPGNHADVPSGLTRRFWFTVMTPANALPGTYQGRIKVRTSRGGTADVPVEFLVRAGTLDPVDIPAGPFGSTMHIPWYEDDPAAAAFNRAEDLASLKLIREYGFTTCSGLPHIAYGGFKAGRPVLDFTVADAEMRTARELGFLAVVAYGAGVSGISAYSIDKGQMQAAGFNDYPAFLKAVYSAVQAHAARQRWLPVYYNLADEPLGEALTHSAENAEAYRRAFPEGPPFFTGASSFTGTDTTNPHFRLSKAFHVVMWNGHDEAGAKLLQSAGSDWAFYNGGSRWTFGTYMYKAAKQYGMKFRISWYWNASSGDPYYALDCREDDYAWCNCGPDGQFIPAVEFERLREGLDDYRRLLTLSRLAGEKSDTPEARSARALIDTRMAAFKLGQREHDELFPASDWSEFRRKVDVLIESLRK